LMPVAACGLSFVATGVREGRRDFSQ